LVIIPASNIISANIPNNISHFRTANPTIEIYQLLLSSTYGSITKWSYGSLIQLDLLVVNRLMFGFKICKKTIECIKFLFFLIIRIDTLYPFTHKPVFVNVFYTSSLCY